MTVMVTMATPAPGLAHRRATQQEQARMDERAFAINTCQFCKTVYRPGSGAAWVCEHHHRPVK